MEVCTVHGKTIISHVYDVTYAASFTSHYSSRNYGTTHQRSFRSYTFSERRKVKSCQYKGYMGRSSRTKDTAHQTIAEDDCCWDGTWMADFGLQESLLVSMASMQDFCDDTWVAFSQQVL